MRRISPYAQPVTSYRIAEAARLLGVSDDTVRRWIDQGVLPVTGDTPTRIPGDALAAHAMALAEAPHDPSDALSSARNRFTGLVTRVQVDGIMAQVDIQAGPHRFVSLLSAEAVRELGLEPGSLAVSVIKATNVIVEAPRETRA
jgi:molybdopterin-binding protein